MVDIAQDGFIALGKLRCDRQAAAVGNGFIADQFSIFMESLADGIVIVIRTKSGRQFLKGLRIPSRPPVFLIVLHCHTYCHWDQRHERFHGR